MPIYFVAVSGFPVAISHIVADFIAKGENNNAKQTLKDTERILWAFERVKYYIHISK